MVIEIEKPKIEWVNKEGAARSFVIELWNRDTVRSRQFAACILLSSLPGAAVTSVKIEGVLRIFHNLCRRRYS